MVSKQREVVRSVVAWACAGILLSGMTSQAGPIGRYRPVTEADVIGMKFNHYFSKDKQHHERDFEWTFDKNEFVIKRGKGAIATDLLEKLLPPNITADKIEGKWKIEQRQGANLLVLSEIKAGQFVGKKSVSFVIYRTAPTVIRVGNPQYVFGLR